MKARRYLSPAEAIKKHCLTFCMNGYSELVKTCKEHSECVFHSKLTNLKKIKAFCKECALDFKPWECDGIVLNTPETREYGKCPLHIFRMGRNPKRKGLGNPDSLKKTPTHRAFKSPESTIIKNRR